MKKRVVGSVVGFASILALGLASCSGNYNVGRIDNKDLENVKNVVKEHVEAFDVQEEKDSEDGFSMSKYTQIDADKYTYIRGIYGWNGNYSTEYLLYKNEKNYVGIYSKANGKFLVNPYMKYELFAGAQASQTDNMLNIDIIIYGYSGKYYIIDSLGNELIKDAIDAFTIGQSEYKNGAYYIKLTNNVTKEVKYAQYKVSDNGKATLVDEIPLDEDEVVYKAGDLYTKEATTILKTEDNKYTVFQYNGAQNTYLDVRDKENKVVKCIELPYGINRVVYALFQNGNMIIQYAQAQAFDAKEYTYSNDQTKYNLYSFKTNIFDDSKVTEISLPYKINGAGAIYNKDKKIAYQEVELKSILDDKTLGPTRYYIMKDDYKLANELHFAADDLIETKNGYYDNAKKVLYNADLEVLTYVDATAHNGYNADLDAFIFKIDEKYGVVNTLGNVVVPFEYNNIRTGYHIGTKVFAENKNGTTGILDISSGSFTELKNYDVFKTGVYKKYDASTKKTTFAGIAGTETKNGTYQDYASVSNAFGKKYVVKRNDDEATTPEYYTITLNDFYFNTIGTEQTVEYTLNNSVETATTVSTGVNKDLVILSTGSLSTGSYFKLTAASDSKLVIKSYAELSNYLDVYIEDGTRVAQEELRELTPEYDDYGRTIHVYTLRGEDTTIDQGTWYVKIATMNSTFVGDVTINLTAVTV